MSLQEEPRERLTRLQTQLFEAKRRHDVPAEVDALLSLAEEAWRRSDWGGAHMHYKLAEDVITGSDACRERLHEALGGQGLCMRRRKRHPEALERFRRAEQAAQQVGEVEVARWKVEQGALHRELKDHEAAHEALAASEALLEGGDLFEPPSTERLRVLSELHGQVGLLALAEGARESAEDAYRRALDHAEAAGDQAAVNTWATNLGNACSRRRSYAEAQDCYVAALTAARAASLPSRLLNTARQSSVSLRHAHRNEEAARVLLDAAQEISLPNARLSLLQDALPALRLAGAWTQSCEVGVEMEELAEELGAPPDYLRDLRQRIDETRHWRDTPVTPLREGPKALDVHLPRRMAELLPVKDAQQALRVADVAHLICDVLWGLPAPNEQSWRAVLNEPLLQHTIIAEAMRALYEHGLPEQSLELSQRYKSAGFALPALRRMRQQGAPHPEAALYLERLEALRVAVRAMEGPAQQDSFLVLERVRAAGEALLEAGELLRERDPILQARMGGLVQPQELLDALPISDAVAIVDLLVGGDGTVGHVLLRQGEQVRVVPLFVSVFTAEHARELLAVWHATGIARTLGGRQAEGLEWIGKLLHDRLFCQLARTLSQWGITQLILLPDLLLRYLPLHLARVCGQEIQVPGVDTAGAEYLCELMPVEYAPCLQAIAVSQVFKRPRELKKIFSIADPRSDLPGARKSAEWLGSQLSSPKSPAYESLVGEQGTLAALGQGLTEADVVLLGTHGHFDPERPEESYLVLADGPWRMASILDQPALHRRPLLVLSACEVGAVAPTTDERVASGLPGALLSAGAASVLASLWPVEDISMGYLIERFLRHLSHPGYRPAAALFRAARDLRRLSREDALARCRALLEELERKGASDRQLILLENLIERIEEGDTPHPFATPIYWGGVVISGSGWHLPAGAMVGPPAKMLELTLNALDVLAQAEEHLRSGRPKAARRLLEQLLPRLEGLHRARALGALARAVAWSGGHWSGRSATRQALRLLGEAERLARAEEDATLVDFIRKVRALIESPGGEHVETH